MNTDTLFNKIYSVAQGAGMEIYVVGGYVRDLLLGKHVKDIDFVVVGDAMKFAGHLKKQLHLRTLVRYPRFGTFMTKYYGYELEFVNARKESYNRDSRKPVTSQADLDTDLSRRDFTINTLAMDISPQNFGRIRDIFHGRDDLEKGLIRTPLDPGTTFADDPLRMLRAVRFATRFNFHIDANTFDAIRKNSERLAIVSQERITDEFNKILSAKTPSLGLRLLEDSNLLGQILPELTEMKGVEQRERFHHKDVFYHTLEVVDNIAQKSSDLKLRLAGLLHDIGKPATKQFVAGTGWTFHGHEVVGRRMAGAILKRLRYSSEIIKYVKQMVALHLRPMALVDEEVTDSAVRRLIFLAGDDIDDLMVLCRADITSKNPKRVRKYMNNYNRVLEKIRQVEERDRLRNFQPPLRGDEIMQIFQLEPGPRVGRIKKFIEEAILNGDIPNDHDACLQLVLQNKDMLLKQE